ncbi:hypothetical protein F383_30536 [Gossypium arboreum]|uniref:Uncharacterized protein n=1 Tax=Gossypium arboreum TaxID=29729 RepID=A0A0B0PJU4_GOSAR|nr:hypothetical protein F383_30536 [Gossypium arboreum]
MNFLSYPRILMFPNGSNGHSEKMNDFVKLYPIQVCLNCMLCLRMRGKYTSK